jgi:hypothetical protein
VWVHGWEDKTFQHAVNRAFMELQGTWDPDDGESREGLRALIRSEDFADAELEYDPADWAVPRIYLWPRRRRDDSPPAVSPGPEGPATMSGDRVTGAMTRRCVRAG